MSNELEIEYETIKMNKNLKKNNNLYIVNASNNIPSQTPYSSQNNSSFIAKRSDILIPNQMIELSIY